MICETCGATAYRRKGARYCSKRCKDTAYTRRKGYKPRVKEEKRVFMGVTIPWRLKNDIEGLAIERDAYVSRIVGQALQQFMENQRN